MGIGLGVIGGSALKTLSNNLKGEKNLLETFFSQQILNNSTRKELITNSFSGSKRQVLRSKYKLGQEIVDLSNRWEILAKKERDLEVSAFFLNLDNGLYAKLSPNKPLPAASSIKIPILLVALEMIDSGLLTWDEPLELTKDVIGGGAGWMAFSRIGTKFPAYEVTKEMIRVSDNTATNILIKRIGGIAVLNQRFKLLGLTSTTLNNLLPDLGGTNKTSAQDLARSIAIVDTGEALSPRSRDLFREVMSTSETNVLLPAGLLRGLGGGRREIDSQLLLKGFRVYNKTGDIGISYADAGLIQQPNGGRAVAGFIVKGPFNDPRSTELIREMSSELIPVLKENAKTQE